MKLLNIKKMTYCLAAFLLLVLNTNAQVAVPESCSLEERNELKKELEALEKELSETEVKDKSGKINPAYLTVGFAALFAAWMYNDPDSATKFLSGYVGANHVLYTLHNVMGCTVMGNSGSNAGMKSVGQLIKDTAGIGKVLHDNQENPVVKALFDLHKMSDATQHFLSFVRNPYRVDHLFGLTTHLSKYAGHAIEEVSFPVKVPGGCVQFDDVIDGITHGSTAVQNLGGVRNFGVAMGLAELKRWLLRSYFSKDEVKEPEEDKAQKSRQKSHKKKKSKLSKKKKKR